MKYKLVLLIGGRRRLLQSLSLRDGMLLLLDHLLCGCSSNRRHNSCRMGIHQQMRACSVHLRSLGHSCQHVLVMCLLGWICSMSCLMHRMNRSLHRMVMRHRWKLGRRRWTCRPVRCLIAAHFSPVVSDNESPDHLFRPKTHGRSKFNPIVNTSFKLVC